MEYRIYKEFFRALGNPTRFRIVQLLRNRPHHVGEIGEHLGYEQSRVSHNLACLLHCGFVEWSWEGKNKVYRLHPEMVPILAALDRHLARYAPQLDSCQVLDKENREVTPVVVLAPDRARRAGDPAPRRRKARRALWRRE